MNKQQGGFTLIELVVVIVILGILAATALPKFVDLRSDAATAATKGVAGAIDSAMAVNYAARLANSTKGVGISSAAQDVSAAAGSVLQGGVPSGYTLSTNTVNCGVAGATATIGITGQQTTTATATLICTG